MDDEPDTQEAANARYKADKLNQLTFVFMATILGAFVAVILILLFLIVKVIWNL